MQVDHALVALTVDRVDGQGQHAVWHQVGEGCIGGNLVRLITGQATDVMLAGAFDHQQRHWAFRARLQDQQAVELEGAHQ